MTSRRGLALILVVGVLGLLVTLVFTFVTLARLERKASLQRVHQTRACLLALSGIQDAVARIGAGQDPEADASRYRGEDRDGDGALSGPEAGAEVYRAGILNTRSCPVDQAQRPSFWARAAAGGPALIEVEGRGRGETGRLEGQSFASHVRRGGFHVNGGDPASPPVMGDYNDTLRRVLGTLAEALDREDGADDGFPVDQADGENLVNLRPSLGWKRFGEIRDLALGGSALKLQELRPYLVLNAWVDRKVLRPNLPASAQGMPMSCWADYRLAHAVGPDGTRAPGFETIGGKVVGRAPVDLAWARHHRPALIALLGGLKGLYLDEAYSGTSGAGMYVGTDGVLGTPDLVGRIRTAEILLDWSLPVDECRSIADQILASAAPLENRQAWDALCDGLAVSSPSVTANGANEHKQAKRDLLKVAFDPNTHLNKCGPNRSTMRALDKTDLQAYSTELSVQPIQDLEITAAGRVLTEGRLLASRTLTATLGGPAVLRLTTQREFLCEDLGDAAQAGDEGPPRPVPVWGTPSAGLPMTWGHALAGVGGRGASLQSYPEPYVDPDGPGGPAPLRILPADADGNLQLATVETEADALYGLPPPIGMKALARFDDNQDLDVHDGPSGAALPNDGTSRIALGPALANGLWHATQPVTFFPDGAYSERERALVWLDEGNANGLRGVMSFWMKRNAKWLSNYMFPRGQALLNWTNCQNDPWENDQAFFLVASPNWMGAGPRLNFFFESNKIMPTEVYFPPIMSNDKDVEHHCWVNSGLGAAPLAATRRWSHVTLYYDFTAVSPNVWGWLFLDDWPGAAGYGGGADGYSMANDPNLASDITVGDLLGPHRIALGRHGYEGSGAVWNGIPYYAGSGADTTFDEFALYDGVRFGSAVKLALTRFREGRYYPEDRYVRLGDSSNTAAAYLSPLLSLPEGTEIRRVEWTLHRPAELPRDYLEVALTDAAGTGYLWGEPDSRSVLAPLWREGGQAWSPRREPAGPFRLQSVFRRGLSLAPDVPVLDSPVLEDLSVVYGPSSGFPLVGWEDNS